jgi:hypothetical protein
MFFSYVCVNQVHRRFIANATTASCANVSSGCGRIESTSFTSYANAEHRHQRAQDGEQDAPDDVPGGGVREPAEEGVAHLVRDRVRRVDPQDQQDDADRQDQYSENALCVHIRLLKGVKAGQFKAKKNRRGRTLLVLDHVGLLVNRRPGTAGLPFI